MEPTRLVNCTGTPHCVRVGDELVLLEELPRPTIHSAAQRDARLEVATSAGPASLRVVPGAASMTVHMPPPRPGVLYLVRPEVLLRCTHRDDLVVPAGYERPDRSAAPSRHPRPKVLAAVHRDLGDVDGSVTDLADAARRTVGVAAALESALAAADAGDATGVYSALGELRGTSPGKALGAVMSAGAAIYLAGTAQKAPRRDRTADAVARSFGALMGDHLPNTGATTPSQWYEAILGMFTGDSRGMVAARGALDETLPGDAPDEATAAIVLVFAIGVLWHLTRPLTGRERTELLSWAAGLPDAVPT